MTAASQHPREAERLRAVSELEELIAGSNTVLDELTRLASTVCDTPRSVVSLVGFDQQYFVARTGLSALSSPREHAFCAHAILTEQVFEIEDASNDPRFADNPLVTGTPRIRHYAGARMVGADDLPLGTLCVFNSEPGRLDERQRTILKQLSRQAAYILDLQRARRVAHPGSAELARVVHDFRAPLRSIAALTAAPMSETTCTTLHSTAIHLLEVADSFLASTAPSAPERDSTADLAAAVAQAIAVVRPLARSAVQLDTDVTPDAVGFAARTSLSSVSLTRMLINLLRNATRHTLVGSILVQALVEADELVLRVIDTGEGIPGHLLPQVTAAGVTSAQSSGGAGLGLAIVRELLVAAGGRIEMESELGSGTTVTLRIPGEAAPASRPIRIAIADDVAVNRLMAETQLRQGGLAPLLFDDGHALLRALETDLPDVVLVDYWMPGLSGPEVVHILKDRFGASLPVVGWTGSDTRGAAERFDEAGADLVLGKPLSGADIQHILRLAARPA